MASVYIKVPVKDRLPRYTKKNIQTDRGIRDFSHGHFWHRPPKHLEYDELVKYWLEEIQLPTEEEIENESYLPFKKEDAQGQYGEFVKEDSDKFIQGVNFILDHIKKGG